MKKNTLKAKRKRLRQQQIIRNVTSIALGVLLVLGLITAGWKLFGKGTERELHAQTAESNDIQGQSSEQSQSALPNNTEEPTPSETPSNTPEPTPSDTPSDTPEPTPSEIPSETPEPTPSETPSDTPEPTPSEIPEEEPEVRMPANEDGSGDAGIIKLADTTVTQYEAPGWQYDSTGWWYAVSNRTYYSNGFAEIEGKTYHFDKNGYIETGWKPIGGKGCYFDEEGVYQPDRNGDRMIAMTFDDGPSQYTAELLDILKENGAHATFFMLGINLQTYGAEIIPRMAAEGHLLGNHSYDHPNMLNISLESAATQFKLTDDMIAQYNQGTGASVIRFPYGNRNADLEAMANRPCFMWNVDTLDWETRNVDANISAVLDNVQAGQIILMHDIYRTTVESCRTIIPELVRRGYELVTVDVLAAAKGVELQNGVTYSRF